MSERDDEPTLLGLLVDDRERSSVPNMTGPAVPPRPERARRTGRTLVIDAFLVRAADDPYASGEGRGGEGLTAVIGTHPSGKPPEPRPRSAAAPASAEVAPTSRGLVHRSTGGRSGPIEPRRGLS